MNPMQERIREILEEQNRMLGYGGILEGGAECEKKYKKSAWIEFLKDYAMKNNMTYACALSDPKASEEYHQMKGSGPIGGSIIQGSAPILGQHYEKMKLAAEKRAGTKLGQLELKYARIVHSYNAAKRRLE
jgi:hypothetical protein